MHTYPISRLAASVAIAAASLCASTGALAQQFSSLYVFGDSLSDNGNNALVIGANGSQVINNNSYIPSQPYGSGTYSNAGVWVSAVATGLGVASSAGPSLAGGRDYAYGGARTTLNGSVGNFPPSAATQVNGYLASASNTASASALYVIAIGGNDVRDTLTAVGANPGNAAAIIGSAAASFASGVRSMVDALKTAGAQRIVVWDAPNVAAAPAVRAQGATAVAVATSTANAYNSALTAQLAGVSGTSIFDIYGTFATVAAAPAVYGLTNVTDACGAITSCDPSKYLFWDGIHPTSAGQAIIARAMLAAVPEPGTWLLMACGLVGLVALRRRATV